VAIDLATGEILSEQPVGVVPELEDHPEASGWGTIPAGGPIVTKSGVVFAATDDQAKMFAYELTSGEEIWAANLPAPAQATPMTYMSGDQQFVVITAGAEDPTTGKPGDYVIAFSLQ